MKITTVTRTAKRLYYSKYSKGDQNENSSIRWRFKCFALGLGCMGMSEFYGSSDEQEAIATIHYALDYGLNFLDTADMSILNH